MVTRQLRIRVRRERQHGAEEACYDRELDARGQHAPYHEEELGVTRNRQHIPIPDCGEGDDCEVPCVIERGIALE